jgi:YYY domain-containing protein
VTEALRFWALIELIGLGAAPLAGVLLARLPGAGLGLGKVLGLLLVTWLVWLGGTSTLVPYGTGSAALWIALVCACGLLAWVRGWEGRRAVARGEPRGWFARRRWRRLAARVPEPDPLRSRLFWGAEAVFAVAFAAMALLVAYSPDVWNTEKPMDMAFVAASNRAETFPPEDPWLAGADLNYYYLGHLAMAVLVKLTAVAPDHGYNLAVAALFGLTAAAVFTVAGTVWGAARGKRGAVGAGLAAVALVVVAGNLEGARLLIADGGPLREYDWFAASRIDPDTIGEFPWFSFLLGDLHAHVLVLPFTLLALAFALQVVLAGPRLPSGRVGVPAGGRAAVGALVQSGGRVRVVLEAGGAALATGFLYAVNSWSYPVMAGLLALAVVAWLRDPRSEPARPAAVRWLLAVLALSALLMLPFHLSFDPAARGIGVVDEGRGFARWLRDELLLFGSLLVLVALAYAGRLLATARPGRNAVWIAVAVLFAGSLLAALEWAHVALLAALLALALQALLACARGRSPLGAPGTAPPLRLVWLLVAGGIACLLGPELLYVRDEFDGSELYRMNTVFKLGYQAWLLLGLAAIGALAWREEWLPRRLARGAFALVAAAVVVAAAVYPVAGTYARKGGFDAAPTLDGLGWLRDRAPGDPGAIAWLNDHAPAGSVVLEAVGDDYSAFGHGRISTFTGLPTVLGWPGHERQWGHDVGTRADEVRQAYAGSNATVVRPVLERYGVRYVVVGPLERTDYGDAGAAKWAELGRRVYSREGTEIWELR